MAIEALTKDGAIAYKISLRDRRLVLFKRNVHGARYHIYRRYHSAEAARAALLQLQSGQAPKD